MKAILVIVYTGKYGWNIVIDGYHSIRKHNKDILIIMVNNFNEALHPVLSSDTNVRYFTNSENECELGAIRTGVYKNEDVTNFYVIHDSCRLLTDIPNFRDDQEVIFFKTTTMDVAPILHHVKLWCETYFPDIVHNDRKYFICQGLMGYFSRDLLLRALNYGLKNLTIRLKEEAVASEAIFGMVLYTLHPQIEIYYDYALTHYINGKYPWKFLQKISPGKNGTPTYYYPLSIDKLSVAHPSYQYIFTYNNASYSSLNDCITKNPNGNIKDIIFNYYSTHKEALHILTSKFGSSYLMENDTYGVSGFINESINKHYLFCIKYFGSYE